MLGRGMVLFATQPRTPPSRSVQQGLVMHVLRFHRDMPGYQAAQANREWRRTTILRPEQRRVGFLGFGMMAKAPALVLQSLGFKGSAWVRNPRNEADVPIWHG